MPGRPPASPPQEVQDVLALPVRYVASACFLSSAGQVPGTRPSGRHCSESRSVDCEPIALSIRTITEASVSGRLLGGGGGEDILGLAAPGPTGSGWLFRPLRVIT